MFRRTAISFTNLELLDKKTFNSFANPFLMNVDPRNLNQPISQSSGYFTIQNGSTDLKKISGDLQSQGLKKTWKSIVTALFEKGDLFEVPLEFDPDNFLYFRCRAISGGEKYGANKNGDYFPWHELKSAYKTFIGRGFYIEHRSSSPELAKGIIIHADLREEEQFVECVIAVDKNEVYTDKYGSVSNVSEDIRSGKIDATSMGCLCGKAECSVCGNLALDQNTLCLHMNPSSPLYMKGRSLGLGNTIAYEKNYDLIFSEESGVANPADEKADIYNKYIVGSAQDPKPMKEEIELMGAPDVNSILSKITAADFLSLKRALKADEEKDNKNEESKESKKEKESEKNEKEEGKDDKDDKEGKDSKEKKESKPKKSEEGLETVGPDTVKELIDKAIKQEVKQEINQAVKDALKVELGPIFDRIPGVVAPIVEGEIPGKKQEIKDVIEELGPTDFSVETTAPIVEPPVTPTEAVEPPMSPVPVAETSLPEPVPTTQPKVTTVGASVKPDKSNETKEDTDTKTTLKPEQITINTITTKSSIRRHRDNKIFTISNIDKKQERVAAISTDGEKIILSFKKKSDEMSEVDSIALGDGYVLRSEPVKDQVLLRLYDRDTATQIYVAPIAEDLAEAEKISLYRSQLKLDPSMPSVAPEEIEWVNDLDDEEGSQLEKEVPVSDMSEIKNETEFEKKTSSASIRTSAMNRKKLDKLILDELTSASAWEDVTTSQIIDAWIDNMTDTDVRNKKGPTDEDEKYIEKKLKDYEKQFRDRAREREEDAQELVNTQGEEMKSPRRSTYSNIEWVTKIASKESEALHRWYRRFDSEIKGLPEAESEKASKKVMKEIDREYGVDIQSILDKEWASQI